MTDLTELVREARKEGRLDTLRGLLELSEEGIEIDADALRSIIEEVETAYADGSIYDLRKLHKRHGVPLPEENA